MITGFNPSDTNPALDRILDFAAEAGLVVLIHNDVDVPFPKDGAEPVYLTQMKSLLKQHPSVPIIWAHCGLGRIVRPVKQHTSMLESISSDAGMRNVYFDVSWDEVAKYIVASPESIQITADLINRYPNRFLFGTDEVAPPNQEKYLRVYNQYAPLWKALSPEASAKVRKANYERLFDESRKKVRAWEAVNANPNRVALCQLDAIQDYSNG